MKRSVMALARLTEMFPVRRLLQRCGVLDVHRQEKHASKGR